jgi:hypothetical protein
MPVACLNAGSKWENNPDCSVDVVEAMTMLGACARTGVDPKAKTQAKLATHVKKCVRRVIPTLL